MLKGNALLCVMMSLSAPLHPLGGLAGKYLSGLGWSEAHKLVWIWNDEGRLTILPGVSVNLDAVFLASLSKPAGRWHLAARKKLGELGLHLTCALAFPIMGICYPVSASLKACKENVWSALSSSLMPARNLLDRQPNLSCGWPEHRSAADLGWPIVGPAAKRYLAAALREYAEHCIQIAKGQGRIYSCPASRCRS